MKFIDWVSLLTSPLRKAVSDIKANTPPPPPASSIDLADILTRINASLPSVITALHDHQGVITGADDLLKVLASAGMTWPATIDAAVLAAPGALTDVQKWLPTVMWALTAFEPAATGIQGDDHHVGRG